MTQIPKPQVEDMPLGTVLPFLKAEDVPVGWLMLDGKTYTRTVFPALVAKMYDRWTVIEDEQKHAAQIWWEQHGGVVYSFAVTLPDISSDEVTALAFGATYLADDSEPVLAIKAERSVTSDGEASSLSHPDPDA